MEGVSTREWGIQGIQGGRGHWLWAQVSGASVLLEENAFFKGRKTNHKKEASAFPCLSDLFITRISDFSRGSRHRSKVFIGREQEEFRVCL